ncbi:barwin-like endoglucanase [Lentinus tigrinus ALCF2SS1-7]|uniref:Barwin-like endoglucanase n=1 Tax=Lentinus tigrinus ALCF2SS1-6 TaxID=1328759 RepID=A0A5C2SJD0_9APHY|nr:barwin-like endoglucanase [Lentinus tigrinus ALCF2SS1-6]RPD78199.1 barwin-like endoglucanase [Lentinus tigrinus ALCF2SS1-7]
MFALGASANEATWYQPGGAYGACGSINQNSDLVAALSPSEYASGANCYRRMRVGYQNKFVDVTIVDLCPSCAVGHIDLSEGAFEQLANLGVGVIQGVTYQYE